MPALSGGMMLYRSRSAKSVACSRLNVIGVSVFFFLPVFVAALTSAEEFHSVTSTGWPAALSHFASSASCVVFPDPSMPSTTNSLPGYSCGVIRLLSIREGFLVIADGDFEADRLAEHALERRNVAMRRPDLELRVAGGAKPHEIVVGARIEVDPGQGLRVAAVEPFGQPHHRRQRFDDPPLSALEVTVAAVGLLWRALAVVTGNQRDHLDFLRIEPAQVAVLDQVVRMPVVPLVADMDADIVEQRAEFQPVALAIAEPVHAARLVEDGECQTRHLLRVLRPVAAALPELDHAPSAHVRVAFDLADARAVAVDVVEDETLAKREIAQRELVGAKPANDRVEEHRAGDREIGAPRIEAGNGEPVFECQARQLLAQTMQGLCRHPLVAQFLDRCVLAGGECAKTQDGAGRADHAVVTPRGDLIEIVTHLAMEMLHQ